MSTYGREIDEILVEHPHVNDLAALIYAMSQDMIKENNEMIAIMLQKKIALSAPKACHIVSKTCMLKKGI